MKAWRGGRLRHPAPRLNLNSTMWIEAELGSTLEHGFSYRCINGTAAFGLPKICARHPKGRAVNTAPDLGQFTASTAGSGILN